MPNDGAIVTFQRIDKLVPASKGITKTSTEYGNKVGTIGLSVLMQKCGISSDTGMKDVSMAQIKEGMCNIGLAKEFDIWSSPSSKLLDYELSFLEYLDQVSRLSGAPELSMQVYYGLRKDHDQQTVQDIYESGNFIIKLVQIKSGKHQGVGSIRVMKTLPDGANSDSLDLERIRSKTLGGFRQSITTMFRETASPFAGGDKAKAALAALGISHQLQRDEEMLKIDMSQNAR
ncbi:uncharacterized protein ColSpa_05163 [Colletotrichum spaethianum]|uniref:Uncharacterized protein n=1 Tax=Colletotrichum spaethianum TaxID=700344 RepID=A0AA37LJ53_9PEZI|nr:uncharacterized protein ColSpa_05163 [Colletotrichum spaethianum]GKT44982.1 hypothetical protein ColSpa_05163 [Colletotrichum spaethianum]